MIAIARLLTFDEDFCRWLFPRSDDAQRDALTTNFDALTALASGLLTDLWTLIRPRVRGELLPGATFFEVNKIAGVPGLAEAMAADSVGWAQESLDPFGVLFPHYEEWNTRPNDPGPARSNAQRCREYRQRKRLEEPKPVDDARDALETRGDQCRDARRDAQRRGEEKRGEEKIPPTPQGGGGQGAAPDGFQNFWDAYPRKVREDLAWTAWLQLDPDPDTVLAILESLKPDRWPERWRRENGRFIPNPSTWLRGRRWEDREGPAVKPKETLAERAERVRRQRQAAQASRENSAAPVSIKQALEEARSQSQTPNESPAPDRPA